MVWPSRDRVRRTPSRLRTLALVGVAAILATSCTAGSEAGDKAGGGGAPVVLTMASGYESLLFEPAVADFVTRVGELSNGTVRIDVRNGWGNYVPPFEQDIVRDVTAGKVDLGWVGTRIFDTLVKSFQALTAPMLIDSYPLEQAVIQSELPDQMLKGLDKLGVTGLAVLADGLRKPIGLDGPLLAPADWRGLVFLAFRSEGETAAVRALGAQPTDVRLDNDALQGFAKNLSIYQLGRVEDFPYVTANVNLWPQTVALLANPERLSRLSDTQQGWLHQAAVATAAHSTSLFDRDAEILATTCRAGARFADASESDLTALRYAFVPVYATLEQDPETKAFIEEIQELKRSTPPGPALPIPAGCTGAAEDHSVAAGPLDGSWQTGNLTESQIVRAFVAAGGSEKEGHSAFLGLGTGSRDFAVLSMTFHDGNFIAYQTADDGSQVPEGHRGYTVADDGTVTLYGGGCTVTYRYDLSGDTLRLHLVTIEGCDDGPYSTTFYASFPFTRSS
jgi:TRAP-type C4-dicarboxylate transport system substrate-binding protein